MMKSPQASASFFRLLLVSVGVLLLPVQSSLALPPESLQASAGVALKSPELPPLGAATRFLPEDIVQLKLVLRLRERRVYLYKDEEIAVSYPVAIGKPGWETPRGTFKILHKVKNPVWENPFNGYVIPPGPGNPLGDRLIVFAPVGKEGFVGFHGTTNESLIGQAVSHGCVRMKNNDIRALFEQVKVGIPVVVVP
jgi:L,D-transpeptidase YnhG